MDAKDLIEVLSEMNDSADVMILPEAKADILRDAVHIAEVVMIRREHPTEGVTTQIILVPEG